MSGRKVDAVDKDDAVRAYLAGKTIKEAAASVGINEKTLAAELRRRGIKSRSRRIDLPETVVSRYLAGESVLKLAREFGVARNVVQRHLAEAGVPIRGVAEAGTLTWNRMSAEERAAQVASAHEAARGRKASVEERMKRAQTLQRYGKHQSPAEERLAAWLTEAGLEVVPQRAVGIYNVDMSVGSIAVEVLGGEWHATKPKHSERTEAILDAGWHVVFVWNTPMYPLRRPTAGYVVAFIDQTGRTPPARREYRVVRGDGQEVARGSSEDNTFALIPPARAI